MLARCLSAIAGAVLGLVAGAFGCAAGMTLAGGGNSHNDMFTWAGATFLSGVLGALTAPPLLSRVLGVLERRRASRTGGATAPPFPRAFVLYLLGSAVALFASGTLFYYSDAIAELPPGMGGPRSDIPGLVRARVSLVASLMMAAASALLFIKALRSEAPRGRRTGPAGDTGRIV